ncbi:hypothetical protein ACH5RR_009091 [Cinchona calisaya]|uniref:Zinc knuckle CX2CX4HX4C domain-containing protein n=1 Tax=Cinchona calisaya TaxID=153742 RepID=A0ABD3ADF0_9GENT
MGEGSRSSKARICVEIDLTKPRLGRVYVGNGEKGKWQHIEYEDVPIFCRHYRKIGHEDTDCLIKNPQLKAHIPNPNDEENPRIEASKRVYENPKLIASVEGFNGSKNDSRNQKHVQWVPK